MRRTTKYIALWVGATALTVTLSWLGVRSVLHSAIFDQPTAVSAARPTTAGSRSAAPSSGSSGTESAQASPSRTGVPRPSPTGFSGAQGSAPPSNIESVDVRGGRAVFSLAGDSARLVSAVPDSGYRTEVSRNLGWIRVDFVSRETWSSVIASWYQHKPTIDVYEQ